MEKKELLEYIRSEYQRYRFYSRDRHFIEELQLPALSSYEYYEIKKKWPYFKISRKDLIWSQIYKKEHGFDPYFICDYQYAQFLRLVNPYKQLVSLSNKAMYDVYFSDLPWPLFYFKAVNGIYLDNKMNVLSSDDLFKGLQKIGNAVIKPTIETGCGKGVKFIDFSNLDVHEIKDVIDGYLGNFIIQEPLCQHEKISSLNPTSLNTCRVTTINIAGKFNYSAVLKVGRKNSNLDNWHSSFLIGVDKEGNLNEFGYDIRLDKYKTSDSGILFSGIRIPGFENIVNLTRHGHLKYFPNAGIIGWDISVDQDLKPQIIEINLGFPGILGEQLASGTFFKEFNENINLLLA